MRTLHIVLCSVLVVGLFITCEAYKRGEKGRSRAKPPATTFVKPELKIELIPPAPKKPCRQSKPGDWLSVHYTGFLENGQVFDSSRFRNQPFIFPLGAGYVIPGWEQGMSGMCESEKRKLTVPPDYAYGPDGVPPTIPPSATLTFEIEMIKISDEMPPEFQEARRAAAAGSDEQALAEEVEL